MPNIAGLDDLIDISQTQDVALTKDDTNQVSYRQVPWLEVIFLKMFEGPTID